MSVLDLKPRNLLKTLKSYDARVKFADRTRIVTGYDPSRPRWVAYVGVFGHDVVGEGATKTRGGAPPR